MTVAEVLERLEKVRRTPRGFVARCPAHEDKCPSLSLSEGDRGILVKCWAGCTLEEVTVALGIRITDLFFETPTPRGRRTTPTPPKLDRVSLAFRFELAALDRRLRADRILKAATGFDIDEMGDKDFDRLMNVIGRAYDDQEHAEFLETVADDLRVKAYQTRMALDAA